MVATPTPRKAATARKAAKADSIAVLAGDDVDETIPVAAAEAKSDEDEPDADAAKDDDAKA